MNSMGKWLEENKEQIYGTYEYLRQIAEVSWKEFNTTQYIRDQLEQLGIPCQTFEEHTGVVATWDGNSEGPVVGLRADIDALWQNVDGQWKANHSCGHDGHATMVLYALKALKEAGYQPPGTLKVLFQPAEETGHGAKAFIERGVVDDIDYLLGIHVRPIQELRLGQATPGLYHGASSLIRGKIKGLQAHGARPHLGVNVIDTLGAIIYAINSIRGNPVIPSSVKMTMVQTNGQNLNIIPDEAEFGIDVRAQTNEMMEILMKKVEQAVYQAGTANGAEVELKVEAAMVAAVKNLEVEEVVAEAIAEVLGADQVYPSPVTPGGEDFHFYTVMRPQIKATVIGLGTDLEPGLHHPNMTFKKEALLHGANILAVSAKKLFEHHLTKSHQ